MLYQYFELGYRKGQLPGLLILKVMNGMKNSTLILVESSSLRHLSGYFPASRTSQFNSSFGSIFGTGFTAYDANLLSKCHKKTQLDQFFDL
jgi:hypothetical protein